MAEGERDEPYRTYEGLFRIIVEQVIDGEKADGYLVDRQTIATPDKLVAHTTAVKEFL